MAIKITYKMKWERAGHVTRKTRHQEDYGIDGPFKIIIK